MMKKKLHLPDLIPLIAFVVILGFFTVASKGRMLSAYTLKLLLEQSMINIIAGCGVIFVVAQGSIDLSVGVVLAMSGAIATWVCNAVSPLLLVPTALLVGLLLGLMNGFLVAKLKVPSFMLSIAELIGLRGIVNYIQSYIGIQYLPDSIRILNQPYIKIPVFLLIIAVVIYVFEFTKVGRYSRAIGENETTARSVGVPVTKMKIAVFAISGLMAGICALYSVETIGGTSNQMGTFLEMKVAMAIFFGGVLVTGGASAKIYKVLLGALSITVIISGLALIGMSESQISESVEGLLLLLILFITILANDRKRRQRAEEKEAALSNE